MKPRVFVTGFGAISALGNNVEEHLLNLRTGNSGIGKAKFFESNYVETLPFAEVNLSNKDLKERILMVDNVGLSRTTLLAFHAFHEAVSHAQLSKEELTNEMTAFISSSTVGGMCHTDELYRDANLADVPSEYVKSYEGSDHTFRIVEHFGLKGYCDTINTACSSSANAIYLGARLIQSGRANRVVVGGADSLAKYTVNGFNSLMILSDEPCQPFDVNRKGLTLGEGAAYLVLENETFASSKKKFAEVTGFGNANDAFHPSTTSDDARGPKLAIRKALEKAKLNPNDIDYINAHGTGTVNNDWTESIALKDVFENVPAFNSTKGFTGHTLAAAGSLESIISILSLVNCEIYSSLGCNMPMEEFSAKPNPSLTEKNIRHVLSNSFGFGGNCTSLIFSRCI